VTTDIDVTTVANAAPAGGNRLVSMSITRATNAIVQSDGKPVTVPTVVPLASVPSWTFRVHRMNASQPFLVEYVIRDLCGDVPRFIGVGEGDAQRSAPPPSTSTPGPSVTATVVTTATPSPSVTVTPSPTTTATTTATPAPPVNPAGRIVPSAARLTATFNSIGVEVPFTGDPNRNATGGLAFRRVGEGTWRAGLPLWPTNDPSGAAFYGSALLLDPGTAYEVRVTIADPDGVDGDTVQVSTVTTRAEDIAPPAALVPNYFVRVTGNDAADGRSEATAWRTIDKAVQDAPSGAVVQVGPGHYPTARTTVGLWSTSRRSALTLVAQYPAVGDNHKLSDPALRSVIEPIGLSSPTGATDGPNPGVWQQIALTGPKTGATYTVWRWADSPVANPTQLGYATTRAGAPIRVAHWKRDTADLSTPAGWAEKLYTNLSYNYGFYADGADVYLRLPGNLDPNGLYLAFSHANQTALAVNGPNVRVSGFEIRQFASGIEVIWGARNAVVDHNLLTGNYGGVRFRGESSVYGSDHVVQDNIIQDSTLWSVDPANPAIPWNFIKSNLQNADGSAYPTSKVGGYAESAGIGGRGSAKRVVVRRNLIEGTFNGVGTGYNAGFDRYSGQDMDVYDNLMRHIPDDALEPELAAINFRAWNNRFEETLTVLSVGPVHYGPVYLFRNSAWRTGVDGVGRDGQLKGPAATMIKYSGESSPTARVFVLHNTFWTDRRADGGSQFASLGPAPEALYLRNNLIRAARYAFEAPTADGTWDEDYNYFLTTDTSRGLSLGPAIYRANVQAYRDATGNGAHTNEERGFVGDLPLMNAAEGDLRAVPSSPLVDAGVPVPNLSDRAGIDYQGAAPDIGVEEH
jgi:hypothetical protein